jgi:hypothetical protein
MGTSLGGSIKQNKMEIAIYDLEGHLLEIVTGKNKRQIALDLKISPATLFQCLRGEINSGNGFQFREVFNNKPLHKIGNCLESTLGNKYTPIHKYWKGSYISTYRNAHEASNYCSINEGTISQCLNGKAKTAGGFEWLYAN